VIPNEVYRANSAQSIKQKRPQAAQCPVFTQTPNIKTFERSALRVMVF